MPRQTIYSIFTSVLITSAGDFRRDSDQLFDETEKDEESGSESLLMTQHVTGSLLYV